MCGSVRLSATERVRFGGDLHCKVNGQDHSGPWRGFARSETLSEKWGCKIIEGTAQVLSYEEHGKHFAVPKGCVLQVAVLTEDYASYRRGDVLIITRDAFSIAEKEAHHRHPLIVREMAA